MQVITNQSKHRQIERAVDVEQQNSIREFFNYFSLETGFTFGQCPIKSQAVYRLRHKVYCEQLGYEPLNEKAMERDHYDSRSHYISISHNEKDETIGCARIVSCLNNSDRLPFEVFSEDKIDTDGEFHPDNFSRHQVCEISRLTVDQSFKKQRTRNQQDETDEANWYPNITLFLYLTTLKHAYENGQPHAYLLSEPRLVRSMRMAGLTVHPIGNYVAHKGLRQPCYIDAEHFMNNLPPQYRLMNQALEQYSSYLKQSQFNIANG